MANIVRRPPSRSVRRRRNLRHKVAGRNPASNSPELFWPIFAWGTFTHRWKCGNKVEQLPRSCLTRTFMMTLHASYWIRKGNWMLAERYVRKGGMRPNRARSGKRAAYTSTQREVIAQVGRNILDCSRVIPDYHPLHLERVMRGHRPRTTKPRLQLVG